MGVHRIGTAVLGAVLVLGTTSCGARDSSATDAAPGPSTGTTSTGSPGTSTPSPSISIKNAADPAHAVADPGPFQPPLRQADILIFGQQDLSPSMIARIKKLKGVDQVMSFALANASIENHSINLAAIDPATYRNYTGSDSAQFQTEWDRVAGGEMAILKQFKKQVPADGYLRLGSNADAPKVHVGVYAPQIPRVDAIVNDKWGQALHMKMHNALLISAGTADPAPLQKPIEKIVGKTASVQRMDIAARIGLDPGVQQTAFLVGTVADAVGTFSYSVLGGGHIAPSPSWVSSHIATEVMPIIGPMTCNKLIFPQLKAALLDIQAQGLADKIHPNEYAGCYYPRFIAGTTTLSNHSFGLAFDINTPGNQRGTVGEIDRGVVAAFEKWGFTWGVTWHYTDPMHFEMNSLRSPR